MDPVKYQVFRHRLWAIGEEGRVTIQRVTASPIVSQGGECMCSFYNPQGVMTLACSGHLRFAAATSDAIKKLIEWDAESPGFHPGDQIFFNDPYVAGAHTYDMMVIKPIFFEDELIAWTASSMHTADVGGLLRGSATEIFHEGIRILGLKVVEKEEFRGDVFRCLTEQCRDPQYVGLDLKSMIAANNVCSRRYLEVVRKFGREFVLEAGEKLIQDSEDMARAKLRELPNGTWMSRAYGSAIDRKEQGVRIYKIVCAMTKEGDELSFDFTGSSPQTEDYLNATLAGTMSHVALILTNHLFWDVPWSDGKLRPVKVHVPEGTILNCRYPAATGYAPGVGNILVAAMTECVAKMRFSGGAREDVNAPWHVCWYTGGPAYFYGGHNREGLVTPQGIYDLHGGGLGAAPTRDGVHTGGHVNIPSAGISDVERTEMQYPFVYFTRNHNRDGGGFGKFEGGMGSFRVYMIYGSQDSSVDYRPYAGVPQGNGLFGGYSTGTGGLAAVFATDGSEVLARMKDGRYPTRPEQVEEEGWGKGVYPPGLPGRVALPEFTIVSDFVNGGAGYGDPLDRDPALVVDAVEARTVSLRVAKEIYGIVLDSDLSLDSKATDALRQELRKARLREGKPYAGVTSALPEDSWDGSGWQRVLQFHEYLELAGRGAVTAIKCTRCGHPFCGPEDNYKRYALRRVRDLRELAGRALPPGDAYIGVYHEYCCPGCATLLQVDTFCPALEDSDDPLWDFRWAGA